MMWQPIETAPKYKDILIQCNNFGDRKKGVHFAVVIWSENMESWIDANVDENDEDFDPDLIINYQFATHWMTLPEPACA